MAFNIFSIVSSCSGLQIRVQHWGDGGQILGGGMYPPGICSPVHVTVSTFNLAGENDNKKGNQSDSEIYNVLEVK